eukprot:TRINITY_DN3853_c0_g1_i8.p1 TRINITY_DN3853_c0_g1~~TRINITY_DN3853_c0_g1_i8.p1  ORF type:complete len:776 (+),score=292.01 TRINITY_DN3853_c0_g1_i8:98-2425(+)
MCIRDSINAEYMGYANSGFSTKDVGNFDKIKNKAATINLPELWTFLKDYELLDQVKKEEYTALVRLVNLRLFNSKVIDLLEFEQFKMFVFQLAVYIYGVKGSMGHVPSPVLLQKMFDHMQDVTKRSGESVILFIDPDSTTAPDIQLYKYLNQKLAENPDAELPKEYEKVTFKQIDFSNRLPGGLHRAIPESASVAYLVLSDILSSAFGFTLVEPLSTVTTKAKAKLKILNPVMSKVMSPQNYLKGLDKTEKSPRFTPIDLQPNNLRNAKTPPAMRPKRTLEAAQPMQLDLEIRLELAKFDKKDRPKAEQVAEVMQLMVNAVEEGKTTLTEKEPQKLGSFNVVNRIMEERMRKSADEQLLEVRRAEKRKKRLEELKTISEEIKKKKEEEAKKKEEEEKKKKVEEVMRLKLKQEKRKAFMAKRLNKVLMKKPKEKKGKDAAKNNFAGTKEAKEGQTKENEAKKEKTITKKTAAKAKAGITRFLNRWKVKKNNEQKKQEKQKKLEEVRKANQVKQIEELKKIKEDEAALQEKLRNLSSQGEYAEVFKRNLKQLEVLFDFYYNQVPYGVGIEKLLGIKQIYEKEFLQFGHNFMIHPDLISYEEHLQVFRVIVKRKPMLEKKQQGMDFEEFKESLVRIAVKGYENLLKVKPKGDIKEEKPIEKPQSPQKSATANRLWLPDRYDHIESITPAVLENLFHYLLLPTEKKDLLKRINDARPENRKALPDKFKSQAHKAKLAPGEVDNNWLGIGLKAAQEVASPKQQNPEVKAEEPKEIPPLQG